MNTKARNTLAQGLSSFFPGYFSIVMATGIVSIAMHLKGITAFSRGMFLLNIFFLAVLLIITAARIKLYLSHLVADLKDHTRGVGFFTAVAAISVLGSQFALIEKNLLMAKYLWLAGILLWFLLAYGFLAAIFAGRLKPSLEEGIHGGWLLVVVSTQSLSVLGALISPGSADRMELILFSALFFYLLGALLYIILITLLLYRLAFFELTRAAFTPSYWIMMGAAAITTLAGGRLILRSDSWIFLQEILPFLNGVTFTFWAVATWWIPLLIILSIWRHFPGGLPLSYEPQLWSLVFTLGMYTTSSHVFADAAGLPVLMLISRYFIYVSLIAWSVTFAAMLKKTFDLISGIIAGEGRSV